MVYELRRHGRTIYCNSCGAVTALVQLGWTASVLLGDGSASADESAASWLRPAQARRIRPHRPGGDGAHPPSRGSGTEGH
jgi:hypothetical protein